MLIIEPKNSSSSIGRSPMLEPRPEMKVSASRDDPHDVVVAHQRPEAGPLREADELGSSWNDTGRSARSFAKRPVAVAARPDLGGAELDVVDGKVGGGRIVVIGPRPRVR